MKIVLPLPFLFFYSLLMAQLPAVLPMVVPIVAKSECTIKKNRVVIPTKQLNNLSFQENLAPVEITDTTKAGKIGFVNTSGELVIPAMYDLVLKSFRHGVATVGNYQINQTIVTGIIDQKNRSIVPIEFGHIGEIRNQVALVQDTQGRWGGYNTLEKIYIPTLYNHIWFMRKSYLVVDEKGKRGLLNTSGKQLIPAAYKQIKFVRDGLFESKSFRTYFIRDTLNHLVDSIACDTIYPLAPSIYKIALNDHYRLKIGDSLLPAMYDSIGNFFASKAIVRQYGGFGLIDTTGKVVLAPVHDQIKIDPAGNIYMRTTGKPGQAKGQSKWGVANAGGNILLPYQYADIGQISEGLLAVKGDSGLWGYADTNNLLVIPYQYQLANNFQNGLARVMVQRPYKKIYYYIDQKGDTAITPSNHNLYAAGIGYKDSLGSIRFIDTFNEFHKFSPLSNHLFKVKYGYKYGVVDTNGRIVVSIDYDSMRYSSEGNCVIVYQAGLPGIFSAIGDTVHPLTDKYDDIFPFHDGYARVVKDGNYGCIDFNKNRRVAMQYRSLQDFQEGLAGALILNKWGFIDKAEQLVVQPYYDEVKPYKRGIARVRTGNYWDFVDKQGKRINSSLYQQISSSNTPNWIINYNGKVGMADSNGRQILVPRYQHVTDLGNGYIQVWKDGKTGLLNYQQNFVIPIEYESLNYDRQNQTFVYSDIGKIENLNVLEPHSEK